MPLFGKNKTENELSGFGSRPWLLVPVCAALHSTYAVGCLMDPQVHKITALHFANVLFGVSLPWVLFFVSFMAMIPMLVKMHAKDIHIYLWPQQFTLILMAASAFVSSYLGSYPDGYKATSIFILTDQSFSIWLMVGHLIALVRNSRLK